MEWSARGFDPERLRSYHTAILLSKRVCAACTLDLNGGKLLSLISENDSLDIGTGLARLSKNKLIPSKPALLSVVAIPDQSAMVPEILSSEKEGVAHLQLLHGSVMEGQLRNRVLEENAARFYFKNGQSMELSVFEHWPSAMFYPLQLQVTRSAMSRVEHGKPTMLLHLIDERLDLVIANEHGPVLVNSFLAKTPEDVLYYALYAVEQSKLNKEDIRTFTAGPQLTTDFTSLLNEYFPECSEAINPKTDDDKLASRFMALIERDICVS